MNSMGGTCGLVGTLADVWNSALCSRLFNLTVVSSVGRGLIVLLSPYTLMPIRVIRHPLYNQDTLQKTAGF